MYTASQICAILIKMSEMKYSYYVYYRINSLFVNKWLIKMCFIPVIKLLDVNGRYLVNTGYIRLPIVLVTIHCVQSDMNMLCSTACS